MQAEQILMRKSHLTEEYINRPTPGTFIMKEQRHFFGSKMMDVEDTIRLESGNDESLKKLYLSAPVQTVGQSSSELADSTKWEFTLDTPKLLKSALYSRIWSQFEQSDFNQINEQNTATKRRSDTVNDYVQDNLMRLYKLDRVLMWVAYYDLSLRQVPYEGQTINLLQYSPVFSPIVKPIETNKDSLAEKIYLTENSDGTHKISYKQTKSSRYTTYLYYMDFIYVRI